MSTHPHWWLSFVVDGKFAGVCIVPIRPDHPDPESAGALRAALGTSWAWGCNPGGECEGTPFDAGSPEGKKILAVHPIGVLLGENTLRAHGALKRSELNGDE